MSDRFPDPLVAALARLVRERHQAELEALEASTYDDGRDRPATARRRRTSGMKVKLSYEHEDTDERPIPGLKERDYGGHFERYLDAPFDRTPVIGESIAFGDRFVAHVAWVLWRLDGTPVLHLEVHGSYSMTRPTRAGLIADGWEERE